MRRARSLLLTLALLSAAADCALAQGEVRAAPAQSDTALSQPPISPGGAFWRSLVVPGWGQAEVGAKSRGAVYFFAEAVSVLMLARTQIRLSHAEQTLPEDARLIEARKEQREDWIAAVIFIALFSGADAFVSAHLYGFDERTGEGPGAVSYGIGWKIPFGP
ncbi:MAG: hypothetical protein V3S83_08105 [Gemmatimonadota bacterium]